MQLVLELNNAQADIYSAFTDNPSPEEAGVKSATGLPLDCCRLVPNFLRPYYIDRDT